MFDGYVKPMTNKSMNRMEVFNEYCLLNCFIFPFLFSDFVPDVQMRYNLGWVFLGIAFLTLFTNFGLIIGTMIVSIREKIKQILYKRRAYKAKKYI
jgi:hypothetical protein